MLKARMSKDGWQQIVHIPKFDSHVHRIISHCKAPSLGSHDMARSLTQSFACDAHSWVVYGMIDIRAMSCGRREAVSMMSQLYGSDACMC
jgi:hypothetical protein